METEEQISIPLARVLSLKEGVVPFEWKKTNIIPLFTKGSRNKLLERLIKDHDYCDEHGSSPHKLLNPSQHGFLKARSCLTNMLFCWKKSLSG